MGKNVYLDKFDIDEDGKLPLQPSAAKKIQLSLYQPYFFHYLILADRVYIQGSAALKSDVLYNIYNQFNECFERDEINSGEPIASFALRENCEGYYDYFRSRESELKKNHATENAEYFHYKKNDARSIAIKLDNNLFNVSFKRREKSVDKKFRYLVKLMFLDLDFCKKYNISDAKQTQAITLCDTLELFQTYKLLEELGLSENKKIAHDIRERYFIANGFGVSSNTTLAQDSHFFNYNNVKYFFYSIGLSSKYISYYLMNSSSIFKIRRLESFNKLKSIYFEKDSTYEIRELTKIIIAIRKKSKYKLLWSESPQSFIAGIFEELAESEILPRFISMPLHELSKVYTDKYIKTNIASEIIEVARVIEEFHGDIAQIRANEIR